MLFCNTEVDSLNLLIKKKKKKTLWEKNLIKKKEYSYKPSRLDLLD